jgi:hypothetical protein
MVTQLAFVHLTFMNIHLGGDVLESYVATSVRHVDTVLRKQSSGDAAVLPAMVEEIQWLQRHAYDLVILACSRSLDQRIFSSPGIPLELLLRLEAAFLAEELQCDARWSRLSNSKYIIFNATLPRPSCCRGSLRTLAESEASAVAHGLSEGSVEAAAPFSGSLPPRNPSVAELPSLTPDSTGSTTDPWQPIRDPKLERMEHVDSERVQTLRGGAGSTVLQNPSGSEPACIDVLHCRSLATQIEDVLKRHGIVDTGVMDDILKILN